MEKKYHIILSFWILLPLLVEVIQVYTIGSGVLYTILLHCFGFVISLFSIRKQIISSDFKKILYIYLFYITNFLLFPANRQYFFDSAVYILLSFYIPIAIFVVRKIVDWNTFFDTFKWFSVIAVLCGVYITMISQVSMVAEYFSYMDFSYFLIPFIAGCYIPFRSNDSMRFIFGALTLLGLFEVLIYGARGAVLFIFLFILLYEVFIIKKEGALIKHFIFLVVVVLVIWISLPSLLDQLSNISYLSDSRFLLKLMNAELFQSEGRDIVYLNAEHRLNNMGLDVAGLFGDREYNNGYWPHNFFYEIWMQMGWIFGSIIILSIITIFYKSVFKSDYPIVAIFFISIFFGRYMVSGSYAIEGRFWIMIFALISIIKPYNRIFYV